jgi:hypothetical protein
VKKEKKCKGTLGSFYTIVRVRAAIPKRKRKFQLSPFREKKKEKSNENFEAMQRACGYERPAKTCIFSTVSSCAA